MSAERIFGCEHEFIGRESELERIVAAAHAGHGLTILAAPGVGASELLRQSYDELFDSESVIPFYFELKRSDRDAASTAKRFAHEFLIQALAFALRDPRSIAMQASLNEISRLAPAEFGWVDAAVEAILSEPHVAGLVGLVTRARRNVVVLIDGLDRIRMLRDGGLFLEAVESLRGVSVMVSGLRRALYGRLRYEQVSLEPLAFNDRTKAIGAIADGREVEITDAARDLLAVQTEGSLASAGLLLAEAKGSDVPLVDFAAVERVYTDSIMGGRIARRLTKRLLRPLQKAADRDQLIRMLAETLAANDKSVRLQQCRRAMRDVDDATFARLIRHLHVEETISATDGRFNMSATPRMVRDYVELSARLLGSPEKRAVVVGRAMVHNVSRAARLMTEFYRGNAAVGVRDLLETFNGQSLVRAAIDYGPFKRQLKGQDDDTVLLTLRSSPDRLDLPRIVYMADAVTFYPALGELCDRDRAAVGLSESGEAWLVAEIDSKLEADAATAEFWCDRLEMAAVNSGFERSRFWLIAPEGFTDEALEVLEEREAYGSSRRQVDFLKELLAVPTAESKDVATKYEITVAMGEEGELVAARTFGDIAQKHGIQPKAVTQVKTALVEALINAAEHSLSPDRKVEVAFAVTRDLVTITVTNRGLKLTAHMLEQADAPSERRGWGLKLIRQLMDEVRVEPTDDGTRLAMLKRLT